MKQYAAELGINLLFIPPGFTEELQPLDCFVFAAMKANRRRMYRVQVAEDELLEIITVILDEIPREKLDEVFLEWITRVRSVIGTDGDHVSEPSQGSDDRVFHFEVSLSVPRLDLGSKSH
jgi:hypothetical protein